MANEFIARKGLIALDNSGISGSLDVSGSLTIESSGSTIFEVIGSEGQLFSITDSLSGSLFAVSDVSGLPILEAFSDDTVKIGTFNNEGLIVGGTNVTASNLLASDVTISHTPSSSPTSLAIGNPPHLVHTIEIASGSTNVMRFASNTGNGGQHTIGFSGHTGANSMQTAIIGQADGASGRVDLYFALTSGDNSTATTSDAVLRLDHNDVNFYQKVHANDDTFEIGGSNTGDSILYLGAEKRTGIARDYRGAGNAADFVVMTMGSLGGTSVPATHTRLRVTKEGDTEISGSITASQNVDIQGTLSLPGFSNVSASLAAAVAGGDDLGNHTATQDLNMGGNAITSVGNVDGVDVSALNSTVSTNTTNIATLTAATSSYSTATGVENNADVTDTANVTAAGALMDSELSEIATVKSLTAAGISGSFNAASASFSTRVTANDAKLTANTSNVQAAGALMDSEVTNLAQVKAFDSSDYATAAQGTKADTAIQPADTGSFLTTVDISDDTNLAAGTGITLTGDTLSTNDSEIDHDSLSNFSADEHFTQANITTVGTVTTGDVSAILPADIVSGSAQIASDISGSFTSTSASIATDISNIERLSKGRITFLYTSSNDASPTVPSGYIHYSDSAQDRIILSTSSYNGVDLDASVNNDYSHFQYGEEGSLLTIRKVSDGSFKTYKVTTVTTDIFSVSGQVGYLVDGASFTIGIESGSISNGDEVEFIWDKSAGVGGAYGPTAGTATKTFAGIYQPGYNYLDMFFGKATDTEFDGSPENLSGVEPSASFTTPASYFLPAISQSESLTLGGLTVAGDIHLSTNNTQITQVLSGGATRDLIGYDGSDNVVIGNPSTNKVTLIGNVTASGNITSSDVYIDDWGSVSASLASAGGGGGGNVSNTGTPVNDQIAVWTDSTTIEGTTKLTFENSTITVHSANSDGTGIEIYGGVYPTVTSWISPIGASNKMNFGDGTSGHIFDFLNNKIAFDGDSTNTYIQANTDDPEDLEIHADQDIILAADNAVVIGAVTDVEDRISSYRTQIVSNGFYGQNSLRYMSFNTTGETTGFNYLSLMPAPANGRLISISAWPQSSGGSTVIGLHINSNATAATTDTQTLTAGTPVTFTFSSNNTFSQNDEISFSVNPTNTPNGLFFSIILEYDY